MEVPIAETHHAIETADHQENCESVENDELPVSLNKPDYDSNVVNQFKLNGSNQLDSFDFTLRQSSEAEELKIKDTSITESVVNIGLINTIIAEPLKKLGVLVDPEYENVPTTEKEDSPVKIPQNERKTIIESDSEKEEIAEAKQKPFKLIDSESEISNRDEESPLKRKITDPDSESPNSDQSTDAASYKKTKKIKKRKDRKTTKRLPVDSDDENELNGEENIDRVGEKEMIAIKSESQRTIREHIVDIPCHKPRGFTLKEFLERKTIVKPTALIKEQDKTFKSNGNIKMNREELKVFAKTIELRKRDIRSFFKRKTSEKPAKPKVEPTSVICPDKIQTLLIEPILEVPTKLSKDINKENVIDELNNTAESHIRTDTETKPNKQEKMVQLSNIKSEVRLSFNYDENSFIDLENGSVVSRKVETKAEQFMNLVLKHMNACKKKKSTNENEELRRLIECDEEYKMDIKPRGSYIKLKKQLEERIMVEKKLKFKLQRELNYNNHDEDEMEEYNEKLEEGEGKEQNEKECEEACDALFDEEVSKIDDDEEENNIDDEEQDYDELYYSQEKLKEVNEFNDDELGGKDNKSKIFSRIKPLDDYLDSSDSEDVPQDNIAKQLEVLKDDKLFSQDVVDGRDVEDELIGLCSGRFETQLSATNPLTLSSQTPNTSEDIPNISLSSVGKDFMDSSGDEDNIICAKRGRKARKIILSDDGSDGEMSEAPDSNEDSEEESEPDAHPIAYDDEEKMIITYDSDENDMALTVGDYEKTKKFKIQNFFENEAELSESDWNSEDEDEKGADNYDIELGDQDQFDAQKLKSELAQIHMRRMLNDDEREVQIIQDMIMPDQEDNEVRERKFRWKNLDNPLVDGQQLAENPDPNEHHSEDENEEYYRKLRFERENLLQSQPDVLDSNILGKTDCQDLDKPKSTKRISIIKTERNKTPCLSTETSFLIGSKNSPMVTKFRDSFLARGEQHLSSLEQLTIDKLEKCATIETAITTEKSAKLFFVIDEDTKSKRKSDDSLENSVNKRKKLS